MAFFKEKNYQCFAQGLGEKCSAHWYFSQGDRIGGARGASGYRIPSACNAAKVLLSDADNREK